jgi:hypothetical protein
MVNDLKKYKPVEKFPSYVMPEQIFGGLNN